MGAIRWWAQLQSDFASHLLCVWRVEAYQAAEPLATAIDNYKTHQKKLLSTWRSTRKMPVSRSRKERIFVARPQDFVARPKMPSHLQSFSESASHPFQGPVIECDQSNRAKMNLWWTLFRMVSHGRTPVAKLMVLVQVSNAVPSAGYAPKDPSLRIPLSWAEASHKNSRATRHLVTENCSRKVQGLDQIHQTDQTSFQDFPRFSKYQLLGHTSSTAWAPRTSCSRSQFPETDECLCWAQRCERQWGRNDPGKRPQTVCLPWLDTRP